MHVEITFKNETHQYIYSFFLKHSAEAYKPRSFYEYRFYPISWYEILFSDI